MARTKEGVTIGFLGTGLMENVDTAIDLIEEYIEANITSEEDPVVFVFPVTTDEFSETLEELVDMAKKSDITYEVITSTSDKGRRSFTDITANAARTYHVADVFAQLEQILTDAPKALLEILWDTKREGELDEIVRRFMNAGIEVLDLTEGNSPFEDPDDQDKAEPVVAADEAEPETAEEPATEETTEAIPIYARSELEEFAKKEGRGKIKEINVGLGLPPRKSIAAMIDQILEAQGGVEEAFEELLEAAEAVAVEAVAVEEVVEAVEALEETFGAEPTLTVEDGPMLAEALMVFPARLHDVLDEFLTGLGKTLEGVIFNATPEEPQEEARPRRLRSH